MQVGVLSGLSCASYGLLSLIDIYCDSEEIASPKIVIEQENIAKCRMQVALEEIG